MGRNNTKTQNTQNRKQSLQNKKTKRIIIKNIKQFIRTWLRAQDKKSNDNGNIQQITFVLVVIRKLFL